MPALLQTDTEVIAYAVDLLMRRPASPHRACGKDLLPANLELHRQKGPKERKVTTP